MGMRLASCVLAGVLAASACVDVSSNIFHPLEQGGGGGGAGGAGGQGTGGGIVGLTSGSSKPPPPDAATDADGICGNDFHTITSQPPTVYFIFDVSGSMVTPVPGGTRYSMLQAAASSLVKDLRYVIRVGAAAFPIDAFSDSCHVGGEIYPPHFDDPLGFDNATAGIQPAGGTPTAATLTALTPKLAALPGKTIAILTTDGGANCNPNATCDISECTENIEGCAPGDTCCAQQVNCCTPSGPAGPMNCIDHAATVSAVSAMAAAGVKVYVVGIPGSQPYANVLTDMAFAGGGATASKPFYYDVEDLGTLSAVLKSIAGSEISCDITIQDPPSMPGYTNVYLNQTLLPMDPANGWTWSSANVITLHGSACDALRSGEVGSVQIVSGCATATK